MYSMARFIIAAFCVIVFAVPSLAAGEAVTQMQAFDRLSEQVPAHLQKVARTLRPNAAKPQVSRDGNGYVAVYFEVDTRRSDIDVSAAEKPGDYIGRVSYVIHEFHSRGETEAKALNGSFKKVKSKRMREYTSFTGGKWNL